MENQRRKKEKVMTVENISQKIQNIIDLMNATGKDTVPPLEMFSLRLELVCLYNQMPQISKENTRNGQM